MKYNHKTTEQKWQKIWEEKGVFHAEENSDKEKFYALIEFPYPSGQGLHVGHPRPYTALDTVARKRRLQGYNVLYPIGWDAFGLPTENYAIKNHIHPKYQICLITQSGRSGIILRHLYTSPRTGMQYLSRNHANNYTHEQATAVLQNLPYPDAFIQSEYDCHYRETDELGNIKDYMCV